MTATYRRRRRVERLMFGATAAATVTTLGVLVFLLGYLAWQGASSLTWSFLTALPAPVGEPGGGMANAIVGSAKLLLAAALVGIPVGFLGGVYLAEYGRGALADWVRYAADVLNGVPSIVIGITIVRVVIPAASRGIATGLLLSLARVAGETAPLLFTALNNRFWSPGWSQPTASLPVMIFTYAIAPYEEWHQQAWAAGLVLLTLVLGTNVAARLLLRGGTIGSA